MKQIILFLLFFFFSLSAQLSGKITYDMTIKVEIPDRVPKEFRDRIPKERKLVKELYFSESVSTYKNGQMERPEDANVTSDNGNDAFDKIRERKPDIIVTEVDIPGIDGFQLLERFHGCGGRIPAVTALLQAPARLYRERDGR